MSISDAIFDALLVNAQENGRELRWPGGRRVRNDANDVALFQRQLFAVMSKVHDVIQAPNKARLFVDKNTEVPVGAETYVWRTWDMVGSAQLASMYADDIPLVNVLAKEQTGHVRPIVDGYVFSLEELERAVFANVPLSAKLGAAAKQAMENKLESLVAFGDAAANLAGFLNNSNVPLIVSPALHGNWTDPATTSQQILDDLHTIAGAVTVQTNEAFSANSMILPLAEFQVINAKAYSTYAPDTIAEVFLRSSSYVKNIESWNKLRTADAAGTGPRVVSYFKDPAVLEMVIPSEFTQYPPQLKNFKTTVPCRMTYGGVAIYYPYAMTYADLAA